MTTNKPGTVTQQPLFGCTRCYEDVSYPADHLHVYNGECWCESCWCEIADWRDWIKLEPFKPALQAENEALRERVAEHEEEMKLFTAVAVMICQQESDEWDSDKVQTHKDYAEVCGQRISKLTPVSAKAWLLRKQAEAVEEMATQPKRWEPGELFAYAQRLRTQADALAAHRKGGSRP